jgi:putative flippase GtrA
MRLVKTALSQFLSRQFSIYLLAGAVPALANFLGGSLVRVISTSRVACDASVVVGYVIGTVVAFFLHRRYTFAVHDEPAGPQAIRFAATAVGALILAVGVADGMLWLWQLLGSPWVSRTLFATGAHVVAIGVNTVAGFLVMKFFALKRRPATSTNEPRFIG